MHIKYKAVVFDFGGVIFHYNELFKKCNDFAVKHGLDAATVAKSTSSPELSELVGGRSLMAGTLTAEELETTVLPLFFEKKFNIKLTERIFCFDYLFGEGAKDSVNECVLTAIVKLREQGYKTALLTNNFHLDEAKKLDRIPVDNKLFDIMVESAVEGILKPAPEMYQLVQNRLEGIKPEEIIFLDDLAENLEHPKELGWTTILVDPRNPKNAVEELEKLLETLLH